MKLTLREKAKLFWERNKVEIISWLVAAGVITGIGAAGAYLIDKQVKKEEAEVERAKKELEEKLKEAAKEAMEKDAMEAAKPENQLACGGYVLPENDNLYEPDWPNLLANSVPLTSMGEFGEEMIRKLREEYPDCEEVGPFVPETAVTDVYIDFGHQIFLEHQKWMAEHPESQEKQAS